MTQITIKDAGGISRAIEAPNVNGRAGAAASRPVVLSSEDLTALSAPALAASEAHVGRVGGESAVVVGTLTRPADTVAYAVGDLVANSTTAGSVAAITLAAARVNGGTGLIRRVRLSTNRTGLTGTELFRVHLFRNDPALGSGIASGDNGVFSVNGVNAIHLGHADVVLDRVFRDGAKGIATPAVGSDILFDAGPATTGIFALIEARGAYTPASGETFTVALEVLRD